MCSSHFREGAQQISGGNVYKERGPVRRHLPTVSHVKEPVTGKYGLRVFWERGQQASAKVLRGERVLLGNQRKSV